LSMRERILTAAEDIMLGEGLARVTTRNIATKVGCSEGTIYRHFKSKQEVFLAVLAERVPEFFPMLRSLSDSVGEGSVTGQLKSVMRAGLAFYEATIPMTAAIFAEHTLLNNYRAWMKDNNVGPHRGVELLAKYISLEQKIGRISSEINPTAAGELLLGSCYLRSYSKQFTAVTPASDNTFISNTIKLLFNGLLPGATEKGADMARERGVLHE
jgi:AcrR family transcriptional regulator